MTDSALSMLSEPLVNSKQVAKFLNVTTKTLERWRSSGEGPRFVRISASNVRYRVKDVEAFIEMRVHSSTAEISIIR